MVCEEEFQAHASAEILEIRLLSEPGSGGVGMNYKPFIVISK